MLKSLNRIQSGMSGYFRVGIDRPSESLPVLLGLKTKVQSPRHSISCILRCAFVATWQRTCDTHASEIEEKLINEPFKSCKITRAHMARVISSIDVAFNENKLTKIQELEYSSIVLSTDIFRVDLDRMAVQCMFYTKQVPLVSRGLIILQRGTDVDALSYVSRVQNKFSYISNIYLEPFTKATYAEVESLRFIACSEDVPSFQDAVYVFHELLVDVRGSIVLDTYGRGQALYIPNEIFLPFKNTVIPPAVHLSTISGMKEVTEPPSYEDTIKILKEASKLSPGYAWAEDMFDGDGNRVEVLTKNGLRIPVIPEPSNGEASEVTQTVIKQGETELTLGKHNHEDMEIYKNISYSAELFSFLTFQLTLDLKDGYSDLRSIMLETPIHKGDLQKELEKWFSETTHHVSVHSPFDFLSKIRKPCGQFKNKNICDTAHMCAWNGKQCKIEIKESVSEKKIFNKLLASIFDNSKLRASILDGLTTPFFSTILYIDLPNEIIFTDYDLKELNATT